MKIVGSDKIVKNTNEEYFTILYFYPNKDLFKCYNNYDNSINDGIPDATSDDINLPPITTNDNGNNNGNPNNKTKKGIAN